MWNINSTDPDSTSSTYNQTYPVFSVSTTGTQKILTIRLYLKVISGNVTEINRMKETVLLRNTM